MFQVKVDKCLNPLGVETGYTSNEALGLKP